MANPTIVSGAITNNKYIIVTFSEGVYASSSHNTDVEIGDFDVTITGDSKVSAIVLAGITKPDGSALTSTGGDSIIRLELNFTGTPEGDGTIAISPKAYNSVYNVSGKAMSVSEDTGEIDLVDMLTWYVSKGGSDVNDGLSVGNSKLTFGSIESNLQPGYNKVHIGIGEYIETVTFDTVDTEVELYGDWDGAIFSSAAGEITHKTSGDLYYDRVTRVDRMTLWVYTSGEYFIRASYVEAITFNYCELKAYTGGSYLLSNTNAKVVTFNHCTQTAGKLTVGNVVITYAKLVFSYWDNITSGEPFVFLGGMPPFIVFDNSSILFDTGLLNTQSKNWTITDSIIKQYDSSSVIMQAGPSTLSGSYQSRKSILIKDTAILDNTGSVLDLHTTKYGNYCIYTLSVSNPAAGGNYNMWTMHSEMYTLPCLLDNINSSGVKEMLMAGMILTEDAVQHNSKDVLYFNSNIPSSYISSGIIQINGLSPSQEYTVKFDYKKAFNSVSSDVDIRFGILTGDQRIRQDLYLTPANAEDYIDIPASTHTYDTWYDDKTLTFTTSADESEGYFLAFYIEGDDKQFKITQPVVAAVA